MIMSSASFSVILEASDKGRLGNRDAPATVEPTGVFDRVECPVEGVARPLELELDLVAGRDAC